MKEHEKLCQNYFLKTKNKSQPKLMRKETYEQQKFKRERERERRKRFDNASKMSNS